VTAWHLYIAVWRQLWSFLNRCAFCCLW